MEKYPNPPYHNLPQDVEHMKDPDGRWFWVDKRPKRPIWTDRNNAPQGVELHYTPDDRCFYIDHSPSRVTWEMPSDLIGTFGDGRFEPPLPPMEKEKGKSEGTANVFADPEPHAPNPHRKDSWMEEDGSE
jgi:hypothetical protein